MKAINEFQEICNKETKKIKDLQKELKGLNARNVLFGPAKEKTTKFIWPQIEAVATRHGFSQNLWHQIVLDDSILQFAKNDKKVKSSLTKLVGSLPLSDDRLEEFTLKINDKRNL